MSEPKEPPIWPSRTPIYCDCCGQEKLAEILLDPANPQKAKLVIRDRRHGKIHVFSESVDRLLASCSNSGVVKLTTTPEKKDA